MPGDTLAAGGRLLRRLRAPALPEDEIPLVRTLHALRCVAEGIAPPRRRTAAPLGA